MEANTTAAAAPPAVDEDTNSRSKGAFSGYAALSMVNDGPAAEEEDEDFGGLMVRFHHQIVWPNICLISWHFIP